MKVFISCDIEGVTTTTRREQTSTAPEQLHLSAPFQAQMTREVVAACKGAIAAGADYILVNDAHGAGINIDPDALPECCELIRGWEGHPYHMVEGIDSSFHAAMFVGYHSAAGREGNPISHTLTGAALEIKVNGKKFSEFDFYSLACAMLGVPSVFLSGDKMLCEDALAMNKALKTVAVKEGIGASTRSISPSLACKKIESVAREALSQNLSGICPVLPESFDLVITYKDHTKATKMSYYPGFKKVADNAIALSSNDYMDVLRAIVFVL